MTRLQWVSAWWLHEVSWSSSMEDIVQSRLECFNVWKLLNGLVWFIHSTCWLENDLSAPLCCLELLALFPDRCLNMCSPPWPSLNLCYCCVTPSFHGVMSYYCAPSYCALCNVGALPLLPTSKSFFFLVFMTFLGQIDLGPRRIWSHVGVYIFLEFLFFSNNCETNRNRILNREGWLPRVNK